MKNNKLKLFADLPVTAHNAGLFISPGEGIHPTRRINSHELIVVSKGTLGIFEEEKNFILKPGDSLLLYPGRLHGGNLAYPPDLSFYWIHFEVNRPASKNKLFEIPQQVKLREPEKIIELLRRFLDLQESENHDKIQLSLLMALILCELGNAAKSKPESSGNAIARKAREFITLHAEEPVSTSFIARKLQCNPDYLGRIYKQTYKITVTEELNRQRISLAKHKLINTSMFIEEIAQSCGFNDLAYFRRVFRKLSGMPPMSFRKLYSRIFINTK
jgi:AraC-like DNA-binding protein